MEIFNHASQGRPRVAIIGAGISGLSAAWMLRDFASLTIYEKDFRAGGHSNTIL
ncbi:MAG: FAD-dependent oxidoreductase, partial [Alphaproteobacteria bacterium]|nr:FAD-dependent oxidoreductase [Alphaproteobacteria bacterium]